MTSLRLTSLAGLFFLAGCPDEKDKTGESAEPVDTAADTGGDTDTGTDTDTGVDTGDTDTGDTNPPLPTDGYFGPPVIAMTVNDGAGGATLKVLDPATGTLTDSTATGLNAASKLACAANRLWALVQTGTPHTAQGLDPSTGEVKATVDLEADFEPAVVLYSSEQYWFGGHGSANLLGYDSAWASIGSVDMSAAADADGNPEIVGFARSSTGLVAVFQRYDSGSSSYDTSAVGTLDLAGKTLGTLGYFSRKAITSATTGMPGGLLAVMGPDGAGSNGSVETYDDATGASAGVVVEFGTKVLAAATTTGTDGTVWAALDEGGAVTVNQYLPDGTALQSFSVPATTSHIAVFAGSVYVVSGGGASTTLSSYAVDGTETEIGTLGGAVYAMQACTPPEMIPDTGDTAAP